MVSYQDFHGGFYQQAPLSLLPASQSHLHELRSQTQEGKQVASTNQQYHIYLSTINTNYRMSTLEIKLFYFTRIILD